MKICLGLIFMLFSVFAFGKSLWENGVNMYKISVKTGDIIKIKFSDKTIMKYRIEARKNNFETTKGKKGGGEIFSFFPNAEVNENDNTRNQNTVNVNNENNFTIPAKVTALKDELVSIQGANSSLINGDLFRIELKGNAISIPSLPIIQFTRLRYMDLILKYSMNRLQTQLFLTKMIWYSVRIIQKLQQTR